MAKNKNTEDKSSSSKPITTDSRFSSVHNDPRFKLPNLKNFKVKVDDRFSKKELKKLNAGSNGKTTKIDRYGRKIKGDQKNNLDKYYEHEESERDDDVEKSDSESEESSSSDVENRIKSEKVGESDSESEIEEDKEIATLDRARGEGLESSSDSDSDSDSASNSDSEEEVEFDEDSELEIEDSKPEEGDPTDTIAVVNMDWDNLRSVDLMATFLSFVPPTGLIKSVTIYPSEFGKEQMQKEELEGPPRELFKSKKTKQEESDNSDSDSDADIDVNNADDLERAARKLYTEDNGEEDYDSKALRRYQLQRLRYYYAIVKCDSISTAKQIYENCDGTEYESTANIFDLRYVPENMDFDPSEARDTCTKIPSSYRPDSNFVTDALQHSKVKLTWDETPKERLTLASRKFSQKEIDDMDFKAYLASDSEESEVENDDLKNKYKSLLGGRFASKDAEDENDEDDVDMEITFTPGLEGKEKKTEKREEEGEEESTIAAYKRKEKERRKRRMDKFKKAQDEENSTLSEDKDKTKKSKDSDGKKKAELELIMMDENNNTAEPEHFTMKDVMKAEKQKARKGKKNKKNIDAEMTQDNFEADLNDPRFKEIFDNHNYAIDPTSSEYKKTETMQKIMKERSKRNHSKQYFSENPTKKHKKDQTNNTSNEIASIVNKLKNKHSKN